MGKQNVEFWKFQVFSGNLRRVDSVLQPASAGSAALPPRHGHGSAQLPLTESG